MSQDDLATPAGTARALRAFGIRPRKRWGQHFLVSRRGLEQILAVAERMSATPGSKDYGILSVAVQYRAEVSLVTRLPASAFLPPPEVESAVVRLDARDRPVCTVLDEAMFFRVVRAAFSQRRKTVRNALAGGMPMAASEAEEACRHAR